MDNNAFADNLTMLTQTTEAVLQEWLAAVEALRTPLEDIARALIDTRHPVSTADTTESRAVLVSVCMLLFDHGLAAMQQQAAELVQRQSEAVVQLIADQAGPKRTEYLQ